MTKIKTLIIGIGNRYRSDDGVGCLIARDLSGLLPPDAKAIEHDGEPAGLIECWQEMEHVILIDAVSSGQTPGTCFHFDLVKQPLPKEFSVFSTHAFGVAEAVELARALNKLPPQIEFYGIEGENFKGGDTLSPTVETAQTQMMEKIKKCMNFH